MTYNNMDPELNASSQADKLIEVFRPLPNLIMKYKPVLLDSSVIHQAPTLH